ncbi:MAG: hypothetical protein C0615_05440 [Desulfuromonas sp.]|nr:MAG: hypothetical protein C0615_05440 [Desulfuromonas sp.]
MTAKVALLNFGGRDYSLPVDGIRHILQEPELFPLAGLCKGLAGVFLFSGEIVPMVSGDILADGETGGCGKNSYTIVYQSDYGSIGLPIEAAVRIVESQDGSFREATAEDESAVVSHFFQYREHNYPVLDIEKLLTLLSI